MKIRHVKQLSLFLQNRPGVLAKLCRALAKRRISVKGLSVADGADHAVVRMVVDQAAEAVHLFEEHGLLVIENSVIALSIPDQLGALGSVTHRLGRAGLNISYVYGSGSSTDSDGTIYLRVDASESRVRRALKGL